MLAVRAINNNTVICRDSAGREMVAMGKGIGFGHFPKEVALAQIDRTFYDLSPSCQPMLQELPPQVLEFAAQLTEIARNELPYPLSPNLVITLADHINFALERARKNIRVKMPVAYDVAQAYPSEYRIGEYAVRRIRKEFGVGLPNDEAAGVAMGLVNSKRTDTPAASEESCRDEEMLEDITEMVEAYFHIIVDRRSFHFSRYASHLMYLFQRIHSGKSIRTDNLQMYGDLKKEFPQIAACTEAIARHICSCWRCEISEEEKLYLMLHINRICAKEGV